MNTGESISKVTNNNEEDFDLTIIWNTFLRNKKSILLVSFISGLLSLIYSFNIKPIWIGGFEILVRQGSNPTSETLKRGQISDLLKGKDLYDVKTQALILKSPSVLLPVYEFVQKEYLKRGIKRNEFSYSSWFNSYLEIFFEKGSKILVVKYKDNDKDLILKTLEEISTKYKEYSKRDKLKSIAKTIKYLNEQKKNIEKRSFKSLQSLNKFSIENGLGNLDGFPGIDFRNNKNNLNKLDNSEINKRYQSQIRTLENYEARYLDLSTNLNPNSKIIQALQRRISNIKNSLKRPEQILIEYKNLKRIANRDLILLDNIDNNLEIAKLERARIPDGWEVISIPTIEDNKYFPNKKVFLLAGFTIAFIITLSAFFIKEKIKGYIYDKKLMNKLIQTNLIESLNLKDNESNKKFLDYLFSKNKGKKNIIINYSSTKYTEEDIFLNSKNIIYDDDSLNNADKVLIIIEEGKAKYDDFVLINKFINLNKEKVIGWIFISK